LSDVIQENQPVVPQANTPNATPSVPPVVAETPVNAAQSNVVAVAATTEHLTPVTEPTHLV